MGCRNPGGGCIEGLSIAAKRSGASLRENVGIQFLSLRQFLRLAQVRFAHGSEGTGESRAVVAGLRGQLRRQPLLLPIIARPPSNIPTKQHRAPSILRHNLGWNAGKQAWRQRHPVAEFDASVLPRFLLMSFSRLVRRQDRLPHRQALDRTERTNRRERKPCLLCGSCRRARNVGPDGVEHNCSR